MPVRPFELGELKAVSGLRLASCASGIKASQALDLLLIEIDTNASVAAVFTQNLFCAAPVQFSKRHLAANQGTRYLLINSGNANAGTGQLGEQACAHCIEAIVERTQCSGEQILLFSTGVIGQPLPSDHIAAAIPQLLDSLELAAWPAASAAIMTTDTYPKGISKQLDIANHSVTLTAIAKGVGMIKPNMATLLAFIATDAQIPDALLQQLLSQTLDKTLNAITVDGDTSTNDSCVLIATGASECVIDGSDEAHLAEFEEALLDVLTELAKILICDGEGATKLVEIQVDSGPSESECKQIAYTIAESPLVKTALFASDANWGRILAAIGNAGVALDISKVDIAINAVPIVVDGGLNPEYTEEQGVAAMAPEDITIHVVLNQGAASSRIWTTDLSYDYIKINAEYRT